MEGGGAAGDAGGDGAWLPLIDGPASTATR